MNLSTIHGEISKTSYKPESTTQTLPSFEEYTPPVTYSEEVEKTLGTPIEVEPLNETKLEEVGLICNHNTPLSSREVPSFDGPEPQALLNSPSLDLSLGDVIGPKPPIKPHSPDSSRMKVVDYLTTQTPPSPHGASSNPKDTYCYYCPCIDDPKKYYGFKPGLLGKSGSLGVDFSNMEMIEVDWELESKEVSFLGRGLNSPVRPKEVEKVIFDKKKLGSSSYGSLHLVLVSRTLRYLAFGRHLEEIHVTWAHLEKKRTRLRTYTNISQEYALGGCRRRHKIHVTPS
ncbi:hypothetical protein Tco_0949325 [Tanacetum coccineum]